MGPNSDIIIHRDSADVTNILTYSYIDWELKVFEYFW